jgi:hypothetical protein
MTRKSTAIISNHLYWFYVYLRYLNFARVANFKMRVEEMYLSHNFVIFQVYYYRYCTVVFIYLHFLNCTCTVVELVELESCGEYGADHS